MKRLLCALLAGSACVAAWGQGLSADANFLTRGEIRSGGLSAVEGGPDFAAFILERTLIGVGYGQDALSVRVTAQHSGVWGSSETDAFTLNEAWVRLSSKKGFFAQLGRQNISYDDQRIFGTDDWAMTARSHDALKLGYEGHGHRVHLVGGYNQNIANLEGGSFFSGGIQPYKSLAALWYHYDIPHTGLGVSLLAMDAGMQSGEKGVDEATRHQQIVGTYLSWKPAKWNLEAAYYRQMGMDESGLPIEAWMTSGKVEFSPSASVSIYGGYDFLSGDKYFATPPKGQLGIVRHDVLRGFSSLYGSHHKFYGAMDFFYVTTYVNGFTPGLQNSFLGVRWRPVESLALDASFHYLATATKLENTGQTLGYEAEFSAFWQVLKDVRLGLGYSFMKGSQTMVKLKRTDDRRQLQWAWLMLNATPSFLNGKH